MPETLEKLKQTLVHLMDVNDVARICLEETKDREAEYQRHIELARENEADLEVELK